MSALKTQVGGQHYKSMPIQPMEYSMKNGLNACQHTAIKYVTRYRDKDTPFENLEKAKHVIDLLMELEGITAEDPYGVENSPIALAGGEYVMPAFPAMYGGLVKDGSDAF